MIIREANISDLEKVFDLWLKLEEHYGSLPHEKEREIWRDKFSRLTENDGGVLVGVEDELINCYLLFYFVNGKDGELENCVFLSELFTLDSFRGRGFAGKLVRKFLEIDFPDFIEKIIVTADSEANDVIEFYERRGFEKIGLTKAGNVKLVKSV